MAIRITSKPAIHLKLDEEKSCAKLISTGSIYSLYVECCDPKNKSRNRVFLAKDLITKKIIAWSIISEYKKKKNIFQFMVYVKRDYRRKGIATKLYNKSKKYFQLKHNDIRVFETDTANSLFFKSVRPL